MTSYSLHQYRRGPITTVQLLKANIHTLTLARRLVCGYQVQEYLAT
jgi:hypothetical protein